jgi:hypothetical protein
MEGHVTRLGRHANLFPKQLYGVTGSDYTAWFDWNGLEIDAGDKSKEAAERRDKIRLL